MLWSASLYFFPLIPMSGIASFWAWKAQIKNASQRLVLLCLAHRHNKDTNKCFPSVKRICEDTKLNKKTVHKAIKELEKTGLISVRNRTGTSNYYSLHIKADSVITPVPESKPNFGSGTNLTHPHANNIPEDTPILDHEHITKSKKKLNRSTRARTLEEDLLDRSWAE